MGKNVIVITKSLDISSFFLYSLTMQRNLFERLALWKEKPGRKPLIIQGARQVGKTWLMREFGRSSYTDTVYVNFDHNPKIRDIFAPDLDTRRILASLEAEFRQKIVPDKTLIIFDEIQECNRALVSLKYFCEDSPEYHVMAAGSFLGVAQHEGNSFPVGKVDVMTLYPLSFAEFLNAAGETGFVEMTAALNWPMIRGLRERLAELLKYYFYVGGMPEVVQTFVRERNFDEVREMQRTIIRNYSADFSKHIAASDIPKVGLLWDSIPAQLGKEKRKFIYSDMKSGARAREYENALSWLVKSGLVYQVNRVSLPNLPLISYREREHFKLYMLDIGLLSAQSGLGIKTLLEPNTAIFNHFKGALAEQYVLQELKVLDDQAPVFYWANDKGTAEVDFVLQKWDEVIPLEVKSSVNLKSKSLKAYLDRFVPKTAIRASLADFSRRENFFEIPLYMIGLYQEICGSGAYLP
jgi:predicted AAA+ superfamily ATPase